MFFDEIVIDVTNLSKRYEIYSTPRDRLKQLVLPAMQRLLSSLVIRSSAKINYQPAQFFREFWALNDISFQVRKGETVGIIGLNGSGKSTLLQLVCSTLTPTSGNVDVKGRLAALLELGSGFNPEFTGRENVFLNGQILGLSREEIQDKLQAIEEFADIGAFIDQPVKTYSSGMVVRLAFSVVAHVEPEILIVDEALAVGDMPFQIKCFAHLRKLRDKGTSILFVSHDLSTVRSFCDRAVYLDHGKCLAVGSANEVCRQYELACLKNKFLPTELENYDVSSAKVTSEKHIEQVPVEIIKALLNYRNTFSAKKREGSQSLTIESFILADQNDNLIESIDPKQDIAAYALIRINRKISHDFHFSIQIHDRQGMPLMVVRDSAFDDTFYGEEGHRFILTMRFSLPLQAGQYYCKAGVLLLPEGKKYAEGQFNFDCAEVVDLIEYAAYFRMLPFSHHQIPIPVLNETKLKVSFIEIV